MLNAGAIAAVNSAGAATPAADAAGLRVLGVVRAAPLQSQFDSVQTYGPALTVDAARGIFGFANSTALAMSLPSSKRTVAFGAKRLISDSGDGGSNTMAG